MTRFANPSFDLFNLSDEHNESRAVLRDLCEKGIAPHAADVDEQSRSRGSRRCAGPRSTAGRASMRWRPAS